MGQPERIEALLFGAVPGPLRWLAGALGIAGLIVIALHIGAEGSFDLPVVLLILFFWTSAALLFLLSGTLARRHPASVPLIYALTVLSLVPLRWLPRAAEGITPYGPAAVGTWAVGLGELALMGGLCWIVTRLWRTDKFDGGGQ